MAIAGNTNHPMTERRRGVERGKTMKWNRRFLLLMISILLAACGSGQTGSGSADNASQGREVSIATPCPTDIASPDGTSLPAATVQPAGTGTPVAMGMVAPCTEMSTGP